MQTAYVGTYQPAGKDGLFHLRFDPATSKLTIMGAHSSVTHPSFLALHPSGGYLYAASEAPGDRDGEVCAFALDRATGALTLINRRPAYGRSTCHVSVDASGQYVIAANYGGPTIVMYPIAPDGTLGESPAVVRHEGSGPHPRQAEAHPHSANIDPGNRFVYCPDLGLDKVMIYRLDAAQGALTLNDPPHLAVAAGAGPRHLAFHPTLPYAYVVNELDSTVTACTRERATGALRELHTVGTLPVDFAGTNTCADIHVHPAGAFVYASNRGHDSLAIFRVETSSGRLTPVGHSATQGRTPRNFALDLTGQFLFAANQDSDTIVTFHVDTQTGRLEPTGEVLQLPTPVCMTLAPLPQ